MSEKMGREELLEFLKHWYIVAPRPLKERHDWDEQAYEQIKHAITVFMNVIDPESRVIEQKPKVDNHEADKIAIEAQAEIGSMSLSTVTAYKMVRFVCEKLGVEIE